MNVVAEETMPPQESLPPETPTKRRRKFWIGYLAGLLCVGLMVWSVVNCVLTAVPIHELAATRRAVMPGAAAFELDAGRHAIDYDTRSTVMGKPFQSPELNVKSPVRCQLVNVATGEELPLTDASFYGSYSIKYGEAIYEGVRLYHVEVDKPGRYELRGEPLADHPDAAYVLAVDDAIFPPRMVRTALLTAAGSIIGFIGLGVLLVTAILHLFHAIRRRRS